MYGFIFKIFGFAIVIMFIVFMMIRSFRRARYLDAEIEKFKKDLEEQEKQGKIANPYAELSEIYSEREVKTRR